MCWLKTLSMSLRWTPRRKLDLLDAIDAGKLSSEEAQTLHALSPEELDGWRRAAGNRGALRVRDQARRNAERARRFGEAA